MAEASVTVTVMPSWLMFYRMGFYLKCLVWGLLLFKTESGYTAQAGLELVTLSPLYPTMSGYHTFSAHHKTFIVLVRCFPVVLLRLLRAAIAC